MKRSYAFEKLSVTIFVLSFFAFLLSSIFLRTYNNSLTIEIQKNKNEIAQISTENNDIRINIQTLSTKDRVVEIANDSGLNLNQENIISIYSGD